MNSFWNDTTPWGSPEAGGFAEKCDLTATSCRKMRDLLNRNPDVKFSCRWFPNGFYNPAGLPVIADADEKKNIILTVGRIGTQQKNNEEMLEAFAGVADILKSWSLRLVGPIEPEFNDYISSYFQSYPNLKGRVIFTGPLFDKEKLYNEYKKAKVFTLSSRLEGAPNVYAEALFHGCKFVTSDIDAADDMTNFDTLGAKYPIGDVKALQDKFVEVCSRADKKEMRNHIPKALAYANRYYDWNRNAKKLAYMLFFADKREAAGTGAC